MSESDDVEVSGCVRPCRVDVRHGERPAKRRRKRRTAPLANAVTRAVWLCVDPALSAGSKLYEMAARNGDALRYAEIAACCVVGLVILSYQFTSGAASDED